MSKSSSKYQEKPNPLKTKETPTKSTNWRTTSWPRSTVKTFSKNTRAYTILITKIRPRRTIFLRKSMSLMLMRIIPVQGWTQTHRLSNPTIRKTRMMSFCTMQALKDHSSLNSVHALLPIIRWYFRKQRKPKSVECLAKKAIKRF